MLSPLQTICINLGTVSLVLLCWCSLIPQSFCWTSVQPNQTVAARVTNRAKIAINVMGNSNSNSSGGFDGSSSSDKNAPMPKPSSQRTPSESVGVSERVVHFCFLIHGWMGNPSELGYLQSAMEKEKEAAITDQLDTCAKLITHSVTCNHDQTFDGVAAGGKRVAKEVHEFISKYHSGTDGGENVTDFTISFIGNSLGGLYARYAISELKAHTESTSASSSPQIHFNVFCTTATPHLGVSKHTFISIPRFAEAAIASVMGATGRDLFRSNDLLRQMAMEPKFIDPLRSFRRRIAYANAFRTDFQVPTCTAAFICRDSDNLHRVVETETDGDSLGGIFFARFQTESLSSQYAETFEYKAKQSEGDMHEMATRLDQLGWTKVFVDTRDMLPITSIKIPFASDRRKEFMKIQSSNEYVKSGELVSMFNESDRLSVPLGHTVMVANSKSSFFSYLNRNGRPVMDYLAREVIAEILKW